LSGSLYADTVVVPAPFETTEGLSSQFSSLTSAERTLQFVYDSTQLGGLTLGTTISGMAFRLDSVFFGWPPASRTWSSYNIQLSKSLNDPGNLSLTFANNIGADVVTVRSGSLTLSAGSFPTGGTPNNFGPVISFTTSYLYTGGDLLITIHTGNDVDAGSVDAIANAAGLYQGLGASTFGATTAEPTLVSNVPVVQLTTVSAPEPSTVLTLVAGMSLLGVLRRRE
jgi:hypothetical protein